METEVFRTYGFVVVAALGYALATIGMKMASGNWTLLALALLVLGFYAATHAEMTLMRNIDKDKLAIALKGASEKVREFFFKNMSTRAAKMLVDDMQALGAVRLRDVDEAQSLLVNIAKDLAAKGEILIAKSQGEDELIY